MNKKTPVDSGKFFPHKSDLDFRARITDRMEKQDHSFNETMERLQQNMQFFAQTKSNAFQMMSQMFASTYREPVHSYSQRVHNTQNYHVFPNNPMNKALSTSPATSHNIHTLSSQDMMRHIRQLEME